MTQSLEQLVYLQKSNTEPQYGRQPVAQRHTVRRREGLWRTLWCRHGLTQSIVGEPQNLNITEQHVSNKESRQNPTGQQCSHDTHLKEEEHGDDLKSWADLTNCLDLVPLVGHEIGPPDADWRSL